MTYVASYFGWNADRYYMTFNGQKIYVYLRLSIRVLKVIGHAYTNKEPEYYYDEV